VFAHNARAVALYRKFGFEEEGRRLREYRFADGSWRDDILMARPVS
jgi:RimJ/RimL family protein N-acetyltransferase